MSNRHLEDSFSVVRLNVLMRGHLKDEKIVICLHFEGLFKFKFIKTVKIQ